MHTHPFVEAYLTKGLMSHQMIMVYQIQKWSYHISQEILYKYLGVQTLRCRQKELAKLPQVISNNECTNFRLLSAPGRVKRGRNF